MKYTEEEIAFLIENYPKYGSKYCQPFLRGRKIDAINATAARYGLSAKDKVVHPDLQNVSISNFKPIKSKEVAYFLGYFWADGNIIKYESGNICHYRIALEIVSTDAEVIMPIMKTIGKWAIQTRQREHWSETTSFTTNNKDLYEFLASAGYECKSCCEPTLILDQIPQGLQIYFWKGLIDGDGSAGLVGKAAYLEIASTYENQYREIDKWFKSLNTQGKVYTQISKKGHKSSVYKVYGKNILPICFALPEYGLRRKSNKLKEIIKRYE